MGPADLTIPGVEVLDELGQGVHGTVYRVRRRGRYYALKVPRITAHPDHGAGSQLASRFLKEAVALARVQHPALPAVMEVGQHAGLPYLIMELVAGETLAERLRRGPLEGAEVLELAMQLASVVARIHETGLVHRDIKPQNILFDSLNASVRLIDFGYAENASDQTGRDANNFTRHRSTGGEEREIVTDLRALGAVLFQSATGFIPFAEVDPRPLLERSAENSNLLPRLSADLSRVLRKLLLSDADSIYPDARAVVDDLKCSASTPESTKFNSPRRALLDAPSALSGRQREMDRLQNALGASFTGRSQIVIVRGAPGSGKTRLVRALLDQVRESHCCLSAVCEQLQREPLGAVRKLLEAELAEFESQAPTDRLRSISRFRELASDVAPLLRLLSARLAHVLRTGVSGGTRETVATVTDEALANFLARLLSEGSPRIVLIDDIQWIDAGSRRVLGHLSSLETPRVLYLLAGRDDPVSWPFLERFMRTLDTGKVWELALDPLDEENVCEFLRAYLGTPSISEELTRYVIGVGDGTPLNILQVLHSILEGGALVPYWGEWKFDASIACELELPRGSLDLLSQRIRRLDPQRVRLLATAAADGMSFDSNLLERACHTSPVELGKTLEEARRAMLLQPSGAGYRFFHDSVREALLASLNAEELRTIHQSLAEALDRREPAAEDTLFRKTVSRETDEELAFDFPIGLNLLEGDVPETRAALETYRVANHYADGVREKTPRRCLEVCLLAGELAFHAFDNDLALRFFGVARQCASTIGADLGLHFEQAVAEAELRTGNLESAIERLRPVASHATDSVSRARAFSRIAWAEMQVDVERAWEALFQGFRALDAQPPTGSFLGVLRGVGAWLYWLIAPTSSVKHKAKERLHVLCHLNDQAARLAANTGRSSRLLQTVLTNLRQSERLGTPRALSGAYLCYSFVLTALGFSRASKNYLRIGEEVARKANDPTVYAYALQLHAVISSWSGDARDALAVGARSLEEYGHWRALSDYCLTAHNQQQLEGLRGRNLEAWRWLELALTKLGKHEGPALTLEFLELSVRACLTVLGRSKDIPAVLSRIANVSTRAPTRGVVADTTYATQVRLFTETGQLDANFERIVEQVRSQKLNPRKVHLVATEYYVHVAHARVHQCLRSEPRALAEKIGCLREAARDLHLAARMPLLRAHATTIDGYLAYFEGRIRKAETLFAKAYELGSTEGAPWVMYAVHRGRAHLLRSRGINESAIDEARLAETLARSHGAAYRLLWIREEFDLGDGRSRGGSSASPYSSLSPSPLQLQDPRSQPRSRGQLKSLVRIGQHTAREFGLAQQAKIVLAELIEATRAERGFLFLTQERLAGETEQPNNSDRPPTNKTPTGLPHSKRMIPIDAQSATGQDLPTDSGYDHEFVEEMLSRGFVTPGSDDNTLPSIVTTHYNNRSAIAAALVLRGERIGAVYLDRPQHLGMFTESDSRTLAALAIQAPLVFELARFLRERERVEETQRSAEKLEAIGRLAGGIAHDFNNMLSVILGVSDQVLAHRSSRSVTDDIKTVQSAAERARDLTRQLLAFSRGQYLQPEVLQLNDLVTRLEPICRQLLGEGIRLRLRLQQDLCRVKADPAQIDQVLTNLVVNARDAMQAGGSLIIETSNLLLHPGRDADELALPPGRYAQLAVTDTGSGIDSQTLAKVFEPFFTTKATGSGLGLPTAYGIIKQSGGHIDVESRVGKGTTFRILLPETEQRPSLPPATQRPSDQPATETVLLVDDEPLVREATRRTLRSLGYQVVGAKNAEEALRLIAEQGDSIRLVITDVMMPGMNGLELARELGKVRPSLKILFISGYTAGVLAERGFLSDNVDFVQKPVSRDALAQRLRSLLDAVPRS